MTAFDLLGVGHAFPVERAACELVTVAGNVDVVKVQRETQQRQQLSCKYHCATHYRQEQGVFVAQVAGEVVGNFLQGRVALFLVKQQVGIVQHGLGFKAFGF